MIYFIQCEQFVKVGFTSNMKNRYRNYITENPFPIRIIGTLKGGLAKEKEIHEQLRPWHHRAEWFHYNEGVRLIIYDIIKQNKDNKEPMHTKRKHKK